MKSPTNTRRVVVTGLGVISSIGIGWQQFWKNLITGRSGISEVTSFDTSSYDRHFAGEVKDFIAEEFVNKKKLAAMGRSSQMVIAASKLALKDAKLNISNLKTGVCVGTTMGESQVIERIMKDQIVSRKEISANNVLALSYPANTITANLANELKIKDKNFIFSTACAAGNYAVGYSYDLIKSGKVDYMLAGGVDSLSRIAFTGFSRLFAMAPEKCQPFDKNRKGMMIGEGAGILLVESLESAQKRNAKIYAEVLNYGLSCDARHMTNASSAGVSQAIDKALTFSKVKKEDVSYISAHGTGTKENDATECQAINKIFGARTSEIPVSSIKSILGHTMGAAAALESITCCLAIQDNEIPPTINHEEDDPDCNIDCVPNKSRKHAVDIALNNSQAFGGNNACLVLQRINNGRH